MSSYLRIVQAGEAAPTLPASPALVTGYEPDWFQKFAIQAIEAGDNVLVCAKTGSGKTFVGEYQIAKSLARGGRVFYTTPIKSLSNQKFHDLKHMFPTASVGIMTGDIKFNPEAQILILTTEILRNLLFKQGTVNEGVGLTANLSLKGVDAVIFDEVHYINDPDRGHVWEETLMLLPPAIHCILLSATLANPEPFAQWLGALKKKTMWLIRTQWRAVPLYHHVVGADGELRVLQDEKEVYNDDVYKKWLNERYQGALSADVYRDKVKDARRGGVEGPIGGKHKVKSFEHQMNTMLNRLHERELLPAIFFVLSRGGCEKLASKVEGDFLDSSDSAAVAHIWDFHLSRYRESLEHVDQYHRLRRLAMRGIAFHHSGIIPFLKEILEILFSKGYVKLLFATETFAVGINMPTKTVLFAGLEKYDSGRDGFRALRSDEYIQMAGRAGRRGKDTKGIVIYLPQRDPIDPSQMKSMMTGGASAVHSRMTFQYDFVLKTLLNTHLTWKDLLQDSYWFRILQDQKASQEKCLRREEDLLATYTMTEDQMSACEAKYTILQTIASSVNSKRKAAQRALVAWEEDHSEKAWDSAYKTWLARSEQERVVQAERRSLVSYESWGSEVHQKLDLLKGFGYVKEDGGLEQKGVLASELNETHPLLATELCVAGNMKSLSLVDQLTVLSVFLGEGREGEKAVTLAHVSVPSEVRCVFEWIEGEAAAKLAEERRAGCSNHDFWALSYEWVEPIRAWLEGSTIPEVCAAFELFEGNFQRALLKLAAVAEEWSVLATLQSDVETLRVMEGAKGLVLRDFVLGESLYLRL